MVSEKWSKKEPKTINKPLKKQVKINPKIGCEKGVVPGAPGGGSSLHNSLYLLVADVLLSFAKPRTAFALHLSLSFTHTLPSCSLLSSVRSAVRALLFCTGCCASLCLLRFSVCCPPTCWAACVCDAMCVLWRGHGVCTSATAASLKVLLPHLPFPQLRLPLQNYWRFLRYHFTLLWLCCEWPF